MQRSGARWWTGQSCHSCFLDRSLFYGEEPELRVVTAGARRLPQSLYSRVVEDLVVPCVDVLLEANDGRFLLVERRDEPMAGVPWLIGGRMWKGETFFDAALRKVKEEVGFDPAIVHPMSVLGVWNAFFNASVHVTSNNRSGPATHTVNVVVYATIQRDNPTASVALDSHHTGFRWVGGLDRRADGELSGLDPYVLAAIHAKASLHHRNT